MPSIWNTICCVVTVVWSKLMYFYRQFFSTVLRARIYQTSRPPPKKKTRKERREKDRDVVDKKKTLNIKWMYGGCMWKKNSGMRYVKQNIDKNEKKLRHWFSGKLNEISKLYVIDGICLLHTGVMMLYQFSTINWKMSIFVS